MHAQVICLQALFESAASTGNFSAVSDFYGGLDKLCDAWGGSIDIKRSLQLSAVKGLVAARKTHSQPVHTVLRSYMVLASFQGAPKCVLGFLRQCNYSLFESMEMIQQYADILSI